MHPGDNLESGGRIGYERCGPERDDCAVICFDGGFEGQTVSWRAEIQTLERIYRSTLAERSLPPGSPLELQQFIEIPQPPRHGVPAAIHIALDVARIDHPTLLKAVVMVRQYKRLKLGRHNYGPARTFPKPADTSS